jgi:outer membrane protein assembly factor BamC
MKPSARRNTLMLLSASAVLNGCSSLGDWFPDKQKQYQYSTEIPALEIPPDLTASTIEGATKSRRPVPPRSAEEPATEESAAEQPDAEESGSEAPESEERTAATQAETPRPTARRPKATAESTLAQSSDNIPLIEIEAPFEIAWNDVAKALGRLELEVSDQNRSDKVYFVYYGGDSKPYEDRGFLGDIAEMFGNRPKPAKEYRVKLEDRGQATLVYILDPDNKPQTAGPGFELLTRLHETLKSLSASESGKGEKTEASPAEQPASEDAETSEPQETEKPEP